MLSLRHGDSYLMIRHVLQRFKVLQAMVNVLRNSIENNHSLGTLKKNQFSEMIDTLNQSMNQIMFLSRDYSRDKRFSDFQGLSLCLEVAELNLKILRDSYVCTVKAHQMILQ